MENTPSAHARANIRALRAEKGWRLADLSEALERDGHHLTLNTLSRIENGDRTLDADDLVALARTLDVTLDRLLIDPARAEVAPALELLNRWRIESAAEHTARRRREFLEGALKDMTIDQSHHRMLVDVVKEMGVPKSDRDRLSQAIKHEGTER